MLTLCVNTDLYLQSILGSTSKRCNFINYKISNFNSFAVDKYTNLVAYLIN